MLGHSLLFRLAFTLNLREHNRFVLGLDSPVDL